MYSYLLDMVVFLADKSYETDEEELKRKEIFTEHLKTINLHNYLFSKGLRSYTMGVNKFTDLVSSHI